VEGKSRLLLVVAAIGAAFVLAGVAYGTSRSHSASNTFVFGASADPVLLDPALISDGESLRVTNQIFESLLGFKPGGTTLVPRLATSWKPSKGGLVWTFNLRKGVKFTDGTPFNAAAVCVNYNRWYNFPAPLQNSSVSYYWNTVFGGFAHPGSGSPGPDKSLYKGCKKVNNNTVQLLLTRRSTSFLQAIALPNFGIASPTALKKYQANAGTVDSTGVFHPTGTFATRNPVGTGPYVFKSWTPGNKLELSRNATYWGKKAIISRLIFRPIADNAARLQALQTGEVQGYDNVAPEDVNTVKGNSKLQLLYRPPFSVGYIGMSQTIKPMDNPLVRQAFAFGLDRAALVKAFYPPGTQVANQFLPPSLIGNAKTGVPAYSYNPTKSLALLKQAGVTTPLKIDFWYPTSVSRQYMPDPKRNAEAFGANLEKAGFSVTFHSAPWRPDYLGGSQAGKYEVYLLGWIADFPDPANFLNVHFGAVNPQFGFNDPKLFTLLQQADAQSDVDKRIALYQEAGIDVMKSLPMVPYVWAGSTVAFTSNVKGFVPSPIGSSAEPFSVLHYG
jgi:peptide/nickel transport system substrate-binding protein